MKVAQPFWAYWGLSRNPFGNISSSDDVFESREVGRVMERLFEAVEEGGIHAVTGERGIGKTTVKNELISYFDENKGRYAYSLVECMDLTKVTMSTINTALISDLSSERPKTNSEHRSRQVTRILGELAAHKKVVLIVDESQRVPVDTLEKLKMLTERRWAFRSKLITVLLFGQVELNQKLARDEGLSLRVTQYRMAGLTPDEVLQYIDLRCRTAGGNMREIFEDEALRYIAENQHSPLHINHVCSTVMRMARQAGEKQAKLCMVFECGGIRTPRQMMRDNNITIKRLAKELGIREYDVQRVVDGNTDDIPVEKRELIRAGLGRIIRGGEAEPEAERKVG